MTKVLGKGEDITGKYNNMRVSKNLYMEKLIYY